MKRMIVNYENLQTRIALTDNDRIEEYYIERQGTKRVVGSIYKGRIRNLEPSLQAAFVDIGLEKNAFLHYWDMIPATKELLEGGSGDGDDDETEVDDDDDDDDDQDEKRQRSSKNKNRRQNNRNNDKPNEPEKSESNEGDGTQESRRRRPGKRPEGDEVSEEKKDSVSVIKRLFSSFSKPEDEADEEGEKGAGDDERRNNDQRDNQSRKDNDHGNQRGGGNNKNQDNQRNKRRQQRPQKKRIDLDEIPRKFQVNSEVVVQVSKGMIGDKGPRVTTNLSIPGRYVVLLPNSDHRGVSRRIANRKERQRLRDVLRLAELPQGMGVICRTAAQEMEDDKILQDIQQLVDMWQDGERMKGRSPICMYQEPNLLIRCLRDFLCEGIDEVVLDSREAYDITLPYVKRLSKNKRPRVRLYDHPKPVFEYFKLDEQISNIFRRKINLPSGAELCIDETEALIAIDINSSKSRGGKDHPETILNTNMEAADEIGRQLKLRNIGGLVVIDYIDMRSRKHQKQVLNKMRQILAKDRAKNRILPISRLGLMELTRQREHASLQDAVFETCSYCHGKGLIKSSTTISVEIQRGLREVMRRDKGHRTPIRVIVHPRVLERLRREDSNILEEMENEFGGELSFRADVDIHQEEFYFVNSETGKEI